MRTLTLAIYAENEGATERRFLPPLVQRIAEEVLLNNGLGNTDVFPPEFVRLKNSKSSQAERILEAAKQVNGLHLLIVHVDADEKTEDEARIERIEPGLQLIRGSIEPICRDVVPIIPIRTTEAWMLVDTAKLCEVIGITEIPEGIALPRPTRLEAHNNPKSLLNSIIKTARERRPRSRIDVADIHEPLARQIDLAALSHLQAYAKFKADFMVALQELGFAR